MTKIAVLLLSVFALIITAGCSKNNSDNESTTEESYATIEETTINNYPKNEYPEDKSTIVPVELYLDDSNGYETEYYEDGSTSDIYTNEENGYEEKINYNENKELKNYEKTVYDEKGRIDCIYVYSNDKAFNYACMREYDSLGRYYRYYFYNSSCNLVCYQVVTYDGYGNELSVELYDSQGNSLEEFPDAF